MPFDAAFMRAIAPRYISNLALRDSQNRIIEAVGPVLAGTLQAQGIDTDLRAVHFLAQACHETMGFALCEEQASGQQYEGRTDLGNTQPGDGPRYKGRGLFQLTGRDNYRSYGSALGLDLENRPEIAADPVVSLRIACEFWNRNRLNDFADRDDVLAISRIINTGHNGKTMPNGLEDRKACLAKAKAALAGITPAAPPTAEARPELRRDAKGTAVTLLQLKLTAAGFTVSIDGDFGGETETAVKCFQAARGLGVDGVVGAATWQALG